jgi:hypothetical protein
MPQKILQYMTNLLKAAEIGARDLQGDFTYRRAQVSNMKYLWNALAK